ncbi:MAG TPA: hypothetical protein VFQ45_09300, partial [Longimicrobium sp.]|nr:hypothetical protein [Longimicrobium sp.]
IAFLIHTLGHYSSALPVLEKVLPLVPFQRERILVLASTARAAGAVRDRLRFERTAAAVVELAAEDSEMSAGALYHVAQGARSFEQWERAAELAARARRSAAARGNQTVAALAGALLSELQRREGGDEDRIPPEGGEVDRMVALVLKRLQKHTAPRDRRAVPPERFPTY